jgi:MOSC domain-containing protein YiiM
MSELQAGLPDILASPTNAGELQGIVVRPKKGERRDLETCEISLAGGTHGDHWAKGCWKSTEDGRPHPDVQICLMNARCIALIAQERENWPPAGDNLFIDMDLTPENTPPGTRLAIGTAVIEITDTPHNGCNSFIERYGRDACIFVNTGDGRRLRFRGIYARVLQDGRLTVPSLENVRFTPKSRHGLAHHGMSALCQKRSFAGAQE